MELELEVAPVPVVAARVAGVERKERELCTWVSDQLHNRDTEREE